MIKNQIEVLKHHDNGVLMTEMVYKDGVRIETRHFHSNGQIAMRFQMNGNLVDGIMEQWDRSGKCLGSYRLDRGSGIACLWHENGVLKSRTEMRSGIPFGIVETWDESGEPLPKRYMLNGRFLSKAKFERTVSVRPGAS
jgi:antitoxin component YwqK of YwqJK toxin-antitoxin module